MPFRRLSTEQHVPKYQRVAEKLTKELQSGKFQSGDRFPSEAALVQRFGTSRITIGRALRELVQRGLVERIAGSGTYVRGETGRALFGLLIPDLGGTEIFEPICHGMAGAEQARGHGFLWGHAAEGATREEQASDLCRQFIGQRVAGVFFAPLEGVPPAAQTNLGIAARLEEAGIPLVLLDRCILPYPRRSGYDLVGIDNRRAGFMAAEHLLKGGARRVAFVAHPDAAPTVNLRLAGYREALELFGSAYVPGLVKRPDEMTAGDFDACVCANDRTAGEVMQALLALGRRIPEDVRIVGIDDVEYASLLPVPLTTVRQPCREIGESAVTAMLERMARPGMPARDILLECRLVVRRSCGSGNAVG